MDKINKKEFYKDKILFRYYLLKIVSNFTYFYKFNKLKFGRRILLFFNKNKIINNS